jgi:leucyl aminopeptidase (aminopeptidase T)
MEHGTMTSELLDQASQRIARQSLDLQAGDTVALVTDDQLEPDVRQSLLRELGDTGATVRDIVVSFDTGNVAMELPDPNAIAGVNAVLSAVTRSLTYNRHIAQVRHAGARVISMPRITRETLERFAEHDFDAMLAATGRIGDRLAAARSVLELRSPAGTDLRLDISESEPDVIDGVAGPGEIDQIPAGVVSFAGQRAEGVIVVDGPVSVIGRIDAPITLRIKDGVIVSIEGGESARALEAILDQFEEREAARHCPAEVGIGTNPSVVPDLSGPFVPEYARAMGMIHVGFGDDHQFPGGSVVAPIHGDFLLPTAEVWLDGSKLDLT